MRHIPLQTILGEIFTSKEGKRIQQSLNRAQQKVDAKDNNEAHVYIDRNGSSKWTRLKHEFIEHLGKKCWYTEVISLGSDLEIDHYRPKNQYPWLAFDPENFRVSCAYANKPHFNKEYQCCGGKGDKFPLMDIEARANCKKELNDERPIILDPCKVDDCNLVVFNADGHPAIHPDHSSNKEANARLDFNKIILNLDHPEFNKYREQLYHTINRKVRDHDEYSHDSPSVEEIEQELETLISPHSQFSSAALCYLRNHRAEPWVERILERAHHASK